MALFLEGRIYDALTTKVFALMQVIRYGKPTTLAFYTCIFSGIARPSWFEKAIKDLVKVMGIHWEKGG